MISPSLINLRNVVATCIACSLLTYPSFIVAQGVPESPIENLEGQSESAEAPTAQVPVVQEPAVQEPATVTLPGPKTDAGSTTKDGSATKDNATKDNATEDNATEGDNAAESQLTLEERRAAWMAELEQLTFAEIVARIRKDERQINQLYINIPLGFPAKQREFQNSIAALQGEVTVLNQLLEPAAVEVFRSDPSASQAAATKVFEVLESKLAPQGRNSKYDPQEGLRLVNTILEIRGGDIGKEPGVSPLPEDAPFLQVIFQGYLACYGLQDFEKANDFLTRLENTNIGLDPKLRETFQATVDAWEKEKVLRDKEAKADDLPRVKLETTNGDVVLELFENEAPNTVANFINLTKDGYYDGLEFFHVAPSNYARSGCTANDGTTHPGYRIRNEFDNGRHHFAGTVVMQNDGENTAGSQFIILHRPDPNLLNKVVAFARVIEGLDIVYGFSTVNRIRSAGGEATIINKATVIRDRGHEYNPETIAEDPNLVYQNPDQGSSSRLAPSGYSGYSSRPKKSGGSSSRPASVGGSSTRPSAVGGSSSRPRKSGGSSSRPRPSATNGSYSRPSTTNGSYSRPR